MPRQKAEYKTYLFQRSRGGPWWIKLRSPVRRVERSLGTTDKALAEVRAGPLLTEHKAALLAARGSVECVTWRHEYEPGREHAGPDGGRIIATERELIYLDRDGRIRIKGPNGGLGGVAFVVPDDRPALAVKDHDDKLLETYITHAGLAKHRTKEARDIWHLFKTVVGKPLAKCTRDDGRAVVAALGEVKSATLRRKMVPLIAAVNLAIDEGTMTFNPFVGCVPDRKDSERVAPFDDADMDLIRKNLSRLGKSDQLLLRVLATMGVRRGEAFAIDREQTENGVRYVMVGSKTEQSLRRVPLPKDLVPFLPKKIKGPLFTGRLDSATKRLSGFLREVGISGSKAPMHSFRHRAKDRLRAAGCPLDVQYELLGHETKTVAAGYGRGSPMLLLRKWLDRIGGP